MTFPNLDNTFLASLSLYRRWKGGKWYLRHYTKPKEWYLCEDQNDVWEAWSRYGGKTPFSYVVKREDYSPIPKAPMGTYTDMYTGTNFQVG